MIISYHPHRLTHSHNLSQTQLPMAAPIDVSSTVDTSRPFRSVKEAVAVMGERLLVGDLCSASPSSSSCVPTPMQEVRTWMSLPSYPERVKQDMNVMDSLKKLEAELEETKQELRLLKEREEDTEVALASLNAELHKNMSKLAEAEAAKAKAAKAVLATTKNTHLGNSNEISSESSFIKRAEEIKRMDDSDSATLAEILSFGDKRGSFGRKNMKKKPIIPLVADLFSRKKLSKPLYSSSHLFN